MARKYVFADESGNFDFSRGQSASKYFILTTVAPPDCRVGAAVLDLRRELAWKNRGLDSEFHATTDRQDVRDDVFAILAQGGFRVDTTILEKSKAQPSIRPSDARFYQMAWFLHMKFVTPRIVQANDDLLVVGASLGTKKKQQVFHAAVQDVMWQVTTNVNHRVAFWSAASEPCLQVADYCSWAIQRKWERGDTRSYAHIQQSVFTEFDAFRFGTTHYY